MGGSTEREIARLLQEGLDHYGLGDVDKAVRSWNEVLFLDPENAQAREYLETAEADDASDSPTPEPVAKPEDNFGSLVDDALRLMREGQLEAALELFETVARRDPERLDVQGYVEMVRSRLLKQFQDRVGDLEQTPRLCISAEEVMKFNLPASAGFLLSLVDGNTCVSELVSLAGMDTFESLRILAGLLDAGILSVGA